MAATEALLASLNAGEISRLALARVDLAKLKVACESQLNFLPHVLGPCMFRPGTQFIGDTASDLAGWLGEFYFDEVTKALLVATTGAMQFLVNDVYVTRVSVATAVTNGTFNTNLAGWTNSDEAGATSSWVAGGFVAFVGTGTNYAFEDQQVTVAGGDVGKEHALRLVVDHGLVSIQIGTAQGDGSYWDLSDLRPGSYSLAFTPVGNFWIRLGGATTYQSRIDSVTVEAAGVMSLPIPYTTKAQFDTIRYDQSGDVIFVACSGVQQRRIERRSSDSRSWAVTLYQADDGPFRLVNVSQTTITPSAITGNITLSATRDVFKSGHVGALFRLTHSGQSALTSIAAQNTFTNSIRVSGLGAHGVGGTSARSFVINVSGTWVGTVTLQRSFGTPGSWADVTNYTTNQTNVIFDDTLDNQIIYYRLGIKTGNYTSGTAVCELDYIAGIQSGVCRITAVGSALTANAEVLTQFAAATPTISWGEGEWSDYRGWPSAVAIHDGRLFWMGGIKIQGSISDAFASFDDTVTGDSAPINRTIATGGLDGGRWLLSLQRLLAGTAAQEISIRSSAFDEPLTPTAFVARACSTRGAFKARPIKIDTFGIFVERNGQRIFELAYDLQKGDYSSRELTRLKQEMCAAGVTSVAAQRQPDTRLWFVLNDGTAVVLTYEPQDDVIALTPVNTQGSFERVAVLPGSDEDDVYFIVKRTINGGTKRFIEKLAKRTECQGGTFNKTLDCHVAITGAPTNTFAAAHLPSTPVVAWADGAPRVTADAQVTTSGIGNAVLPGAAATNVVIGLSYTGQIKTAKLAYGAERGTALEMLKRVARVGLVMADVAWKGVRIGRTFAAAVGPGGGLPNTYKGKPLLATDVLTAYDVEPGSFNGGWDSDARVCIQVASPYCATIMGLVLNMDTNEPNEPQPAPRNAG